MTPLYSPIRFTAHQLEQRLRRFSARPRPPAAETELLLILIGVLCTTRISSLELSFVRRKLARWQRHLIRAPYRSAAHRRLIDHLELLGPKMRRRFHSYRTV